METAVALEQTPYPAPVVVSTIDVDKLEGSTTTIKSKDKGKESGRKLGSDSPTTVSPRSQHQLNKEAEPTQEAKALINNVLAMSKEWQSKRKTATQYFEQHKLEVLKLRNEFGVKQGTKGKLLYVAQPDRTLKAMYWSDFVRLAFGVSERHINRLLGIAEAPDPPDPTKSKNYKLGFAAGQETALRGQVQTPVVSAPASKLDKGDPYVYFEQFKGEKQTFASELAAMVVHFYDFADADEMIKALAKEMKRQIAEIRKASVKPAKE